MLSELRLQDFRCFSGLSLEIPAEGALFIGDNAQGKTSILEAVCMLVRLQSPRASRQKTMIRGEANAFGVSGECWGATRKVRFARGGLVMEIDGEEVKQQSLYFSDGGLVVWMGNADLDLIRGSGEIRRRYIDFLGCQLDPQYRTALSRYRRGLKNRNLLLKNPQSSAGEISAYDSILIEAGDFLTQARKELIDLVSPHVSHAQLSVGGSIEQVAIQYKSGTEGGMRAALNASLEKDRRRGQTSVGPHRDDLKFLINDLPAADFASEGQQRTLALALKLGQGELLCDKGEKTPIYLVDDIFGELDTQRRNAVLEFLPKNAQVLITTTNVAWLNQVSCALTQFKVEKGNVFLIK